MSPKNSSFNNNLIPPFKNQDMPLKRNDSYTRDQPKANDKKGKKEKEKELKKREVS
jgi:hypothetical protein